MKYTVNEVTGLYSGKVWGVVEPEDTKDVINILKRTTGDISIGGGRFSMGGQIHSEDSLHIDMRKMNKVLAFHPQDKTITVQAGIRWCDIQKFIDPYDLSLKIMQTYANFTVGGSLSVNCHGRYIGLGPVILSVNEITLILANGETIVASPNSNSEFFWGSIGCYGAIGVITEVSLSLTENLKVKRISKVMPINQYTDYFKKLTYSNEQVLFHNADIYPPHYSKVRATSWIKTDEDVTQKRRLNGHRKHYLAEKYFLWAISETVGGKWRRENIVDKLLFASKKVHWRNYEAGYDVLELEPVSRKKTTYVLQEYFIPVKNFHQFTPMVKEIVSRYNINLINISIRHALKDSGSYLAWATEEVFAFVFYYKQPTSLSDKNKVAVWTRELIEASLKCNGRYYLPYQAHGTIKQFNTAYKNAHKLFDLKDKVDPNFRFKNVILNQYYKKNEELMNFENRSEFIDIMRTNKGSDDMYLFLQNVFHLYPEEKFLTLIAKACSQYDNDEDIYRYVQNNLKELKNVLSDFKYTLPALNVQKKEMSTQTLNILKGKRVFDGYLEIGSKARYYSKLKNKLKISGKIYMIEENEPTYSPPDIMERGSISKVGKYIPLNDYEPISDKDIPNESLDLIICYIGIHHAHPDKLIPFLESVKRTLRKGGSFIIRDHDAYDEYMVKFVSLIHTVFNLGLNETWETDRAEPRYFKPLEYWIETLESLDFSFNGEKIYQDNDPSKNALMLFVKE